MGQTSTTAGRAAAPFGAPYVAAFVAVLVALIAPLWVPAMPPLSDYLNHVARADVLARYGQEAAYRAFYAPAWGPYPNLAFDLFTVPVARVVGAETAGKLFLSLTVALFATGSVLFGRALLGRPSLRALLAAFFAYSESFLLGYASFSFGMGLMLAALSLFVGAGGAVTSVKRQVGFAALALGVVVSHAAAFVTLCLACGAIVSVSAWQARSRGGSLAIGALVRALAPLLPAGLYFLSWLLFFADHSADRGFSSPGTSARLLLQTMLPTYSARLDLVVLGACALAAAAALALARPLAVDARLAAAACLLAAAVFEGARRLRRRVRGERSLRGRRLALRSLRDLTSRAQGSVELGALGPGHRRDHRAVRPPRARRQGLRGPRPRPRRPGRAPAIAPGRR